MDSTQYKSWSRDAPIARCVDGTAVVEEGNPLETFLCKNMDLHDFKSHADLGSTEGEGSSSWGWVSKTGREFAAIGQFDGTAFAEISKEGKLVYLGRLPAQSVGSQWREIRVLGDYCIIGSEAVGHNVQIFDMKKLLTLDPESPTTFSTTDDLTGLFSENIPIGRVHNIVVNNQLNYAVAVGAQPRTDVCASGLIFIDMSDPSNPTSPGCASSDGYVHDAECVVYSGPDKRYTGRDICYGYNEDSVTIYDVTDKSGLNASSIISRTAYEGVAYTHQGAVLDLNNQEYLLIDDELDEVNEIEPAADGFAVTYIMDIRDLENPVVTGHYKQPVRSIDHNQYVFGDYVYQSNYGAGIRVLDISSIPKDNTGAGVHETAFFDIYPEDDAEGGIVEFVGTWSHYAGYPSGHILVNTIERGAFIVKINKGDGPKPSSTTTKGETSTATSKSTTKDTTTTTTSISTTRTADESKTTYILDLSKTGEWEDATTVSISATKEVSKTAEITPAPTVDGEWQDEDAVDEECDEDDVSEDENCEDVSSTVVDASKTGEWEDVSSTVAVITTKTPSKTADITPTPSATDGEWKDENAADEECDEDVVENEDCEEDEDTPEQVATETWADYAAQPSTLETVPAPAPTGDGKPAKPVVEETSPADKPYGGEADADVAVEKPAAPIDEYSKPTPAGEQVAEFTGAASKTAFSSVLGLALLGLALMW